MDPNLSDGSLFVGVIGYLFLIVLACGSGYWMARFLPVRFNGEKVIIGLLIGSLVALASYGLDKLMQERVHLYYIIWSLAWFSLQGLAGEITVQVASRRRRAKL